MGIPGFNTYFQSQNKAAYVPVTDVQVDHVYVDMNSVLHNCLRKATSVSQFHEKLYKQMDQLLKMTNPRKSVMLAVDGPAPLAKLLTQRARRKAAVDKEERTTKKKSFVSSTALTPGTRFMHDIAVSLAHYVCARLVQYKWRELHWEVSGATVAGEGEVKILGRLARPWDHVEPHDTHVIVGDDADLILMALVSYVPHLHLLNVSMRKSDSWTMKDMRMLSVDLLHQRWSAKLLRQDAQFAEGDRAKLLGVKSDMALFAIIANGNDYLPPIRGCVMDTNGRPKGLWTRYKELRQTEEYATRSIVTVDRASGAVRIDAPFLAHLMAECRPPNGAASKARLSEAVEARCREYLRGLVWVLDMYIAGDCPDYRWHYDASGPSDHEMITYLLSLSPPLVSLSSLPPLGHATAPLLPHVCSLALLPRGSRELLPKAIRHIMDEDSPVADLYNDCEVCLELAKENCEVARTLEETGRLYKDMEERLSKMERQVADEPGCSSQTRTPAHDAQLAQLLDAWEAAKAAQRAISARRDVHKAAAHPYEPFPLQRLLEAAGSVALSEFGEEEAVLAQFGASYLFRHAQNGPPLPGQRPWSVPRTPVPRYGDISPNVAAAIRRAIVDEDLPHAHRIDGDGHGISHGAAGSNRGSTSNGGSGGMDVDGTMSTDGSMAGDSTGTISHASHSNAVMTDGMNGTASPTIRLKLDTQPALFSNYLDLSSHATAGKRVPIGVVAAAAGANASAAKALRQRVLGGQKRPSAAAKAGGASEQAGLGPQPQRRKQQASPPRWRQQQQQQGQEQRQQQEQQASAPHWRQQQQQVQGQQQHQAGQQHQGEGPAAPLRQQQQQQQGQQQQQQQQQQDQEGQQQPQQHQPPKHFLQSAAQLTRPPKRLQVEPPPSRQQVTTPAPALPAEQLQQRQGPLPHPAKQHQQQKQQLTRTERRKQQRHKQGQQGHDSMNVDVPAAAGSTQGAALAGAVAVNGVAVATATAAAAAAAAAAVQQQNSSARPYASSSNGAGLGAQIGAAAGPSSNIADTRSAGAGTAPVLPIAGLPDHFAGLRAGDSSGQQHSQHTQQQSQGHALLKMLQQRQQQPPMGLQQQQPPQMQQLQQPMRFQQNEQQQPQQQQGWQPQQQWQQVAPQQQQPYPHQQARAAGVNNWPLASTGMQQHAGGPPPAPSDLPRPSGLLGGQQPFGNPTAQQPAQQPSGVSTTRQPYGLSTAQQPYGISTAQQPFGASTRALQNNQFAAQVGVHAAAASDVLSASAFAVPVLAPFVHAPPAAAPAARPVLPHKPRSAGASGAVMGGRGGAGFASGASRPF